MKREVLSLLGYFPYVENCLYMQYVIQDSMGGIEIADINLGAAIGRNGKGSDAIVARHRGTGFWLFLSS